MPMRTRTLILTLVFLACCQGGTQSPAPVDAGGEMLRLPADIDDSFVPALWGEAEATEVNLDWKSDDRPGDDDGTCVRIAYRPVDEYWAAVYWQTTKDMGVRHPVRLPEGSLITFWARGGAGGEVVEFKLPGEPSHELLTLGEATRLGTDWKRFELRTDDGAGEPVTGLFGIRWDCVGGRNAGGLTIYLDDLRIEPSGREHSDRGENLPAP